MCRKSGFTLIELLVVIAIIALLLSIITPSLRLAKEKANNLFCRANVRSLALGFRLYTETNDGKVFGYGSSGGNNLWLMQISEQLGDTNKVRYCPSTKLNEAPPSAWGSFSETWIWTDSVTEPEHGSFGINGFIYSDDFDVIQSYIVPAAEWESSAWKSANVTANSASIPIFIDAIWVDLWPQDDDFVPAGHDLEEMENQDHGGDGASRNHLVRCMVDRHGGRLSVSFLDGHVEPVALSKMWSLKWSEQFATDAKDHLRTDDTPIYK